MNRLKVINKNIARLLIPVIMVSVLNSACWLSPKEAAQFAKAGTTYTTAMDLLLVRTSDLTIDANSEFTLDQDRRENIELESYIGLRNEDRNRLKAINRLRRHTKLLARYFEMLFELSTSKAPEETSTAIDGLVGSINNVGSELRGNAILKDPAREAIRNVASLIVTVQIRQAVNKELKARNKIIRQELITQEELLKALSAEIEQSLSISGITREKRLVIAPITAETPIRPEDINKWKENRREAVRVQTTIDDLETASDAVKKLREAYESLLSGKLNMSRITDALADFEIIISTAESIKEATKGEK